MDNDGLAIGGLDCERYETMNWMKRLLQWQRIEYLDWRCHMVADRAHGGGERRYEVILPSHQMVLVASDAIPTQPAILNTVTMEEDKLNRLIAAG